LKDARVDPGANENKSIKVSGHSGHVETIKLLLAEKRVDGAVDDVFKSYIRAIWSTGLKITDTLKLLKFSSPITSLRRLKSKRRRITSKLKKNPYW
jgi:hypothetical protein